MHYRLGATDGLRTRASIRRRYAVNAGMDALSARELARRGWLPTNLDVDDTAELISRHISRRTSQIIARVNRCWRGGVTYEI